MPAILIDIGNTRTKIALFANQRLQIISNTEHKISKSQVDRLLKQYHPTHMFVANVNASRQEYLTYAQQLLISLKWNNKLQLPIVNKYQSKTIGQDRLAMASAANKLFPSSNVLVVSCGTCITYDFVNEKNEYLGGAISPGMKMRFKALHQMTARLPLVKDYHIGNITGSRTPESIQSGVMHGIAGEIHYTIQTYKKNYRQLKVILSGGDARYFEPHLNYKIFAAENLVLQGLQYILQLNYPTLV